MFMTDDLLLDFRITSYCNLDCDLCFRNPNVLDHSTEELLAVIDKMYQIGFRKIGFTGGEPTTRKDYIILIKHAKKKGFLTYLSTVGHKFTMDHSELNPILDWIGLPIDGITKKVNTDIRSEKMGNQHNVIKNILMWLPHVKNSINIKLTTVVSNSNIENLTNIVEWIEKLPYIIQSWRFYQFCPLGLGKDKRDKLEISKDYFLEKMKELKIAHPELPISWATFEERDKANVVMEPNFDVIVPDGDNYTYLCNMKNDPPDKILSSIFGNDEIIKKCRDNRFWIEKERVINE